MWISVVLQRTLLNCEGLWCFAGVRSVVLAKGRSANKKKFGTWFLPRCLASPDNDALNGVSSRGFLHESGREETRRGCKERPVLVRVPSYSKCIKPKADTHLGGLGDSSHLWNQHLQLILKAQMNLAAQGLTQNPTVCPRREAAAARGLETTLHPIPRAGDRTNNRLLWVVNCY